MVAENLSQKQTNKNKNNNKKNLSHLKKDRNLQI